MRAQGALLLAAGNGRRMGGPKAWLELGGRPLLETQLRFLVDLFPAERIAVSIQEPWLARCRALAPSVAWIPVDPGGPPLASLQALLRGRAPSGWIFLHHVDMPVWERGLFAALEGGIPEAARGGLRAVVPAWGGRRGHPVLLSPEAASELGEADSGRQRLDHWLRDRALVLEVPYPCALSNWNSPADRVLDPAGGNEAISPYGRGGKKSIDRR